MRGRRVRVTLCECRTPVPFELTNFLDIPPSHFVTIVVLPPRRSLGGWRGWRCRGRLRSRSNWDTPLLSSHAITRFYHPMRVLFVKRFIRYRLYRTNAQTSRHGEKKIGGKTFPSRFRESAALTPYTIQNGGVRE